MCVDPSWQNDFGAKELYNTRRGRCINAQAFSSTLVKKRNFKPGNRQNNFFLSMWDNFFSTSISYGRSLTFYHRGKILAFFRSGKYLFLTTVYYINAESCAVSVFKMRVLVSTVIKINNFLPQKRSRIFQIPQFLDTILSLPATQGFENSYYSIFHIEK